MNSTLGVDGNDTAEVRTTDSNDTKTDKQDDKNAGTVYKVSYEEATVDKYLKDEVETPSHVRKMIEVRTLLMNFR